MSPISRTSLDKTFRNRTRTNTDPAVRAANIAAARAAFEEKEAAKSRRLEKQQSKQQEREKKKQEKKDLEIYAKIEKVNSGSVRTSNEKPLAGPEYSNLSKDRSATGEQHQERRRATKKDVNMWALFMTWLRTKVFKTKRKVRRLT